MRKENQMQTAYEAIKYAVDKWNIIQNQRNSVELEEGERIMVYSEDCHFHQLLIECILGAAHCMDLTAGIYYDGDKDRLYMNIS